MTPARRLVYDFLSLPHHVQMRVFRELGYEFDGSIEEREQFVKAFAWAAREKKIDALREAVAAAKPTVLA